MSLCSFVFSALHGMLTWTTMHRGLAMRNVSVRLSVCLSVKRVIVTKRKKNLSTFIDTCLMNRKSISKLKFDKISQSMAEMNYFRLRKTDGHHIGFLLQVSILMYV